MAQEKLKNELLALSEASDWGSARREWYLEDIVESDYPETCACGHRPINELCYIRNRKNDARLLVGNHCVRHFFGIRSDLIFTAIKRVMQDPSLSLNAEAIEFGYQRGWIDAWQREFYLDTMKKQKPSEKQLAKREEINKIFGDRFTSRLCTALIPESV